MARKAGLEVKVLKIKEINHTQNEKDNMHIGGAGTGVGCEGGNRREF